MKMDMYSIIKSLCDERGISIYEMCKDTGIGRSVISELKAGRSKTLGADKARKIAEYFNVSVDYLLGKTSFRNAQALYEFWGTNDPDFEASFDFGRFIQLKREEQGVSLKEMSTALGITESDLDDCEQGILPLNLEWAEKMANFLDTNVSQLLFEHDLYEGKVPEEYHDDVRGWETLVKAAEDDAANDSYEYRKSSGDLPNPDNIIPYTKGHKIPIIGSIPAGSPVLAQENIEGYDYADVPEDSEYFYLRVKGDSMKDANILDGSLVLVKSQPCAENGQIVVCLVNGDEATLKRFYQQKDMVILKPENPAYQPVLISCNDFESGYARILGVATEVKLKL